MPQSKDDGDEDEKIRKDGEKPVPPYGSKAYWEERYEKGLALTTATTSQEKEEKANQEDPDAFHNWYFSYDDLRPILLPLVLGGKLAAQSLLGGDVHSDDEEPDDEEPQEENDDKSPRTATSHATEDSVIVLDKNSPPTNVPEDEEDDDQSDQDDGWEEASDSNDDSQQEDDAEEPVSQLESGLAAAVKNGPLSVLEIGCGDAPLVLGLAKDMHQHHHKNTNNKTMVHRIVCTDYSSTLIDALQRMHHKKRKSSPGDREEEKDPLAAIEFLEADARNLPFPNESFHLILEKGTMDAMISDPDVGVSNCIQIVRDSARVLATGGCFVLVSHINAQTEKGEEWLNTVVVAGLRKAGTEASWSMEVHGNAATVDDENQESAGPAVYLIFKGEPTTTTEEAKSGEPATIPLQFFCY